MNKSKSPCLDAAMDSLKRDGLLPRPTQTQKATPRPWFVSPKDTPKSLPENCTDALAITSEHAIVAVLTTLAHHHASERELADARLIVTAVNQHAALLAVAEAAKRVSDSHSDGTADVEPDIFGAEMIALDNALAALKETEAQS